MLKTDSKNTQTDPYLEQKILSASPEQLIAYVYDAAISGCITRDIQKASSALHVLIDSLNFGEKEEQKEVSARFYNTYDFIFNLIRNKKFEEAHTHLKEIRKTWANAMKVY